MYFSNICRLGIIRKSPYPTSGFLFLCSFLPLFFLCVDWSAEWCLQSKLFYSKQSRDMGVRTTCVVMVPSCPWPLVPAYLLHPPPRSRSVSCEILVFIWSGLLLFTVVLYHFLIFFNDNVIDDRMKIMDSSIMCPFCTRTCRLQECYCSLAVCFLQFSAGMIDCTLQQKQKQKTRKTKTGVTLVRRHACQ